MGHSDIQKSFCIRPLHRPFQVPAHWMGLSTSAKNPNFESSSLLMYPPFLVGLCFSLWPIDFNQMPLAPMGTQIVAHTSADCCMPFGQHGKVGWYIGPSLEHY
jgi:hypothetical protein